MVSAVHTPARPPSSGKDPACPRERVVNPLTAGASETIIHAPPSSPPRLDWQLRYDRRECLITVYLWIGGGARSRKKLWSMKIREGMHAESTEAIVCRQVKYDFLSYRAPTYNPTAKKRKEEDLQEQGSLTSEDTPELRVDERCTPCRKRLPAISASRERTCGHAEQKTIGNKTKTSFIATFLLALSKLYKLFIAKTMNDR